MPDTSVRAGLGASMWRAFDLTSAMREVLGHHLEACFDVRTHKQGARHEASGAQEFITKAIEEL